MRKLFCVAITAVFLSGLWSPSAKAADVPDCCKEQKPCCQNKQPCCPKPE